LNDALMMLADTTGGDIRLMDYVTKGGPVGYVILALSLVALGLVVANVIQLRMESLCPPKAVAALEDLLGKHDIDGAQTYCVDPANDSFLTRMFASALVRCQRSPFGFLELKSALEESGQRQVDKLTKLTDGVGLVAALGPMLGLLGTVFGMIGAFRTLGELEGAARSSELAKFMSHALVATALGLLVAIPCTAAFTYFKRRIDRLAGEIGQTAEELAALVQGKQGRDAGARPAAKAPAGPRGLGAQAS